MNKHFLVEREEKWQELLNRVKEVLDVLDADKISHVGVNVNDAPWYGGWDHIRNIDIDYDRQIAPGQFSIVFRSQSDR